MTMTPRSHSPAPGTTRPRLARIRRHGAHREVAAAFLRLALEPAAAPVAEALRLAAWRLPGNRPAARTPARPVPMPASRPLPSVEGPLTVEAGLRPLLGELGLEALEEGRPDHAVVLLAALSALAPESPAGPIALAAVWLAVDRRADAIAAASEAAARAPHDPAAKAALAEALLFSGRREGALRVVASVRGGTGAAGRWARGLVSLEARRLPAPERVR